MMNIIRFNNLLHSIFNYLTFIGKYTENTIGTYYIFNLNSDKCTLSTLIILVNDKLLDLSTLDSW